MIKEKSLFSLQFLAKTMISEGYRANEVRKIITQVVFCFFCDNFGLFFGKPFTGAVISSQTADLASKLNSFFDRLPETMSAVHLGTVSDRIHRILKQCCSISWQDIHPSIFGAVCQSVMDAAEQHDSGAHYTSLQNVHRVIDNLFLDDMIAEMEALKDDRTSLLAFYEQLCKKTFLDPACGCGNFLLETLAGLRMLEIELIRILGEQSFHISSDQLFGIEISPDAAELCRTALFIENRMLDIQAAEQLRKPLELIDMDFCKTIIQANALRIKWNKLVPAQIDYIIGNPPFLLHRNKEQSEDIDLLFNGIRRIDYSAGWILKAAKHMVSEQSECAFITTNSVCQGCQVKSIWQPIIEQLGFHINFAYPSFRWESDISNNKIDLSCVIVAFSRKDKTEKRIYTAGAASDTYIKVKNINAYLFDGPAIYPDNRNSRLRPVMQQGSDRGKLLKYSLLEAQKIIAEQPMFSDQLTRFISADNMLTSVQEFVFSSDSNVGNYIIIPRHSSEKRKYIPVVYLPSSKILCSESVHYIADGNLYIFGLLCSAMHNAWTKQFCGRLDMRIRYSNTLIYNNFPFPDKVTDEQKAIVASIADKILTLRQKYAPFLTLGKLYNELPNDLLKTHLDLDIAVEKLYRKEFFVSDRERVNFLINLYNAHNE